MQHPTHKNIDIPTSEGLTGDRHCGIFLLKWRKLRSRRLKVEWVSQPSPLTSVSPWEIWVKVGFLDTDITGSTLCWEPYFGQPGRLSGHDTSPLSCPLWTSGVRQSAWTLRHQFCHHRWWSELFQWIWPGCPAFYFANHTFQAIVTYIHKSHSST